MRNTYYESVVKRLLAEGFPYGRSAHTEDGGMAGQGKRVIVYIPEIVELKLMYKLFNRVIDNLDDLIQQLRRKIH